MDVRVAFLRGINVGRAKRVAMADLCALVEGLGYRDVRTLLNSGNVVFSVPAKVRGDAAARIEAALATSLGVSSRVTVLSSAEVATIVRENPLNDIADDPSRLLVMVLANAAARALLQPLLTQRWTPEAIALGPRVAYLWCPRGIIASALETAVGRVLGDAGTARNIATMTKLSIMTRGS